MVVKKSNLFPRKRQKDYDWAFAHYGMLAKRYPNQWVAFANRHVLAAGPRLKQVLDKSRQKENFPDVPHLFVEAGIHVYAHCA